MNNITLTIDMNKRCAECQARGTTPSGICLDCAIKAMDGKPMRSPQGAAVAQRFAAVKRDFDESRQWRK